MPGDRHPGDVPGETVWDFEVLSSGTRLGEQVTDSDLDEMAAASRACGFTAPLCLATGDWDALLKPEGAPAVGWLCDLKRVGSRLVGNIANVPRKLARLIRQGGFSNIATEVFHNFTSGGRTFPRVVKRVILSGSGLPRVGGLADLEALYSANGCTVHSYTGRLICPGDFDGPRPADHDDANDAGGAACPREHEEAEMDRPKQTNAVHTDAIDAEVMMRVHAYQQADASLSFEDGYRQLPHRDPDLWRRYREKTYATVVTVAESPAEQGAAADWHQAGLEILREADRYQQASPELSREEAIRAVLRDHTELARRYVRAGTPPGT